MNDHQVAEVSTEYLAEATGNVVPAGYKKTEVGVIPVDWDSCSLGELCLLKSGLGITSKNIDDSSEYRCYGGNGLRGYTKNYTHEGEYVLIGRQGALCGNIQYVTGRFFASEHALVATPVKGVNAKWLAIYLDRMNLNQYSESSAQPGLSAEKLRVLNLAAPVGKEQTAIANALSDVDALISELEKLIAKKQAIKTATMQQLLTGRTRLPQFALREDGSKKGYKPSELGEIPEDWAVVSISQLGVVVTGGTPLTKVPSYWNGNIPWVTPTDIGDCKDISKTERGITNCGLSTIRSLPENTVLVTCIASIGKNAILRKRGACNQQINAIVPSSQTNVDFLYYSIELSKERLKSSAGITATPIISKALFSEFDLVLPKLQEQTAIATILSDMDDDIQALGQRLAKTRQIKQGMMQELLTGKTRLV